VAKGLELKGANGSGPQPTAADMNQLVRNRVARFFLVQTYQNGKNIPNDHKLYQMAIKYSKWQHFESGNPGADRFNESPFWPKKFWDRFIKVKNLSKKLLT
jgi:hypothetical protein